MKIGIQGYYSSGIISGSIQNFSIGSATHPDIGNMLNVPAGVIQMLYRRMRQSLVE
jgi:hypothetical protein